jgi:hypothetical protein
MKKYLIYKITNHINGKYYIGAHETFNIDDGYFGSGLNIKKAIEKYGIENFTREILFIFDNRESMYEMERTLVTENLVKDKNCYNAKLGGHGGWDSAIESRKNKMKTDKSFKDSHVEISQLGGQACRNMLHTDKKFKEDFSKSVSNGIKSRMESDPEFRERKIKTFIESAVSVNTERLKNDEEYKLQVVENLKKGRETQRIKMENDDEYKKKRQEQNKKANELAAMANRGTFWITNGYQSKKIKTETDIEEGWYRGRVISKNN